jgi:hypothetical protein
MKTPWGGLLIVLLIAVFMFAVVGAYAASDDGKLHYTLATPAPRPSPSSTLTILGFCDKMGCVGYGTKVGDK